MNMFNMPAKNYEMLVGYARLGLGEKIDDLPDFESHNDYEMKFARYEEYMLQELIVLREIGFDGYMLLLQDIVRVSREISEHVQCFGSITNSLAAYALGIVDNYEFNGLQNFINFTPFSKNVRVNILISSYAENGCLGYVKHKYPNIITKMKRRSIMFNDELKIKFIDLDVDVEVNEEDLSELTKQLLKNNKIIK